METLNTDYHRENTMVVFMADHGEMLGEHGFMGHGFGVHEELVHVPLFMRVPGMDDARQIETRISTTRVFYSVLDYFGFETLAMPYAEEVDVASQSLLGMVDKKDMGQACAIAEAMPRKMPFKSSRSTTLS